MVGRSSKARLCQLFSGQYHAGIAKKELAIPPNQGFANLFQAGRTGPQNHKCGGILHLSISQAFGQGKKPKNMVKCDIGSIHNIFAQTR